MSRECRHNNKSDLNWPPASRAEMEAWQVQVGTDLEIARFLGLSRASIYGQRTKFGVPALPRKKRARVREKRSGPLMTRFQMARLYGGRRYEDRIGTPRPRRSMPPGFGLREPVPAPYLIAAE